MLKCLCYLGVLASLAVVVGPVRAKPQRGEAGQAERGQAQPAASARASRGKKAPCRAPAVRIVRRHVGGLEARQLNLTFCDGRPNPAALASLSLLARPRDVDRPSLEALRAYSRRRKDADRGGRSPAFLSERVLRVHPGLAVRLQHLARSFPGRTIELVSGHRPTARLTSRHHHGRAFDLRVLGVSNERVRDCLRALEKTGVGYYPNSTFVHVDVRADKGYWVDRSGPGEPADYGPWPPRRKRRRARSLRTTAKRSDVRLERSTRAAMAEVRKLERSFAARRARTAAAPRKRERPEPEVTAKRLSDREVGRIRAEARKALASLAEAPGAPDRRRHRRPR